MSIPDSGPGYPTLLLGGTDRAIDAAIGELCDEGCLGLEAVDATRQRAFFPPGTDLFALSKRLAEKFAGLRIGAIEVIPQQDWLARSRSDMVGYALGERFFICPSWASPPGPGEASRIVLQIDPEQAFGTGRHDTTRLCLELLENHAGTDVAVIDVGTGTGILAMAAAWLGCRPVLAIEIDPDAAACARHNAERNGLGHLVQIVSTDVENAAPDAARVLVANLSRSLLERQMGRLSSWVAPGGYMILSGITVEDVEDLTSMVEKLPRPMELVCYYTAGEWAALLAKSPAQSEG